MYDVKLRDTYLLHVYAVFWYMNSITICGGFQCAFHQNFTSILGTADSSIFGRSISVSIVISLSSEV